MKTVKQLKEQINKKYQDEALGVLDWLEQGIQDAIHANRTEYISYGRVTRYHFMFEKAIFDIVITELDKAGYDVTKSDFNHGILHITWQNES